MMEARKKETGRPGSIACLPSLTLYPSVNFNPSVTFYLKISTEGASLYQPRPTAWVSGNPDSKG